MWKTSTTMILGAVLMVGAMSTVPETRNANAPLAGDCALRVQVFTLAQLKPLPDDLAYRVAFFLKDVPPRDLGAPTARAAVGQATNATALFDGPKARWNFRRPMPGPSDPDAFVLQTPQEYVLYRPASHNGFASLGLVGVAANTGLSHPAFFGHISATRFFAAEPQGDITTCILNPTTIFKEVSAVLDHAITAQAPDLEEISNG